MEMITSPQNSFIKELKALKLKKNRQEQGLFFIEGIKFVDEALKENADIVKIVISENLNQVKGGNEILSRISTMGLEIYTLPQKLFKGISDTESPQGILAVIKAKQYLLTELICNSNFIILLDCIQDPGNLGTIIRTADAAGVTGIIISEGCVDLYNPKVLRSTMGSVFRVPIFHSNDLVDTINVLKKSGVKIYTTHLSSSTNYCELEEVENIGVVVGNEANGVSEAVVLQTDLLIKIPMPGKAESLNAAVAAGIIMFEIVKKKFKAY